MLPETLPILLAALALDALFGYPDWIFRKIGHPVTWIGAAIRICERLLNREGMTPARRRFGGILTIVGVTAAASLGGWITQSIADALPGGWLLAAAAASTMIASRSLYEHVRDVAIALEKGGLDAGRCAVSRIVGRDPETLDAHGVARAAIESLAENASDGVTAPVFWFALLGLPGLAAYKAINTADSMIGHRTPRYEAFGWASARLDDLVNLPASRLTAAFFVLAALFDGASPRGALRAIVRDARLHRSPNAGWPEAAMAGALGLKLAGPRFYEGVLVQDAAMGDGRAEATANDIWRALRLAKIAWLILFAAAAVAFLTVQF
jgi:adenosylcobinamide-phosphate synthase